MSTATVVRCDRCGIQAQGSHPEQGWLVIKSESWANLGRDRREWHLCAACATPDVRAVLHRAITGVRA